MAAFIQSFLRHKYSVKAPVVVRVNVLTVVTPTYVYLPTLSIHVNITTVFMN